jgi:hypothetical protein
MAKTARSKMRSRIAMILAVVFFVAYGLASTVGSIFLVTWGSPSLFKTIMIFLGTFPINWHYLIVEKSVFYLLLNILFWTTIVYLLVLFAEKLIKLQQKKV